MKKPKEKIKDWFNQVGQLIASKLNVWINPLSPSTKKRGFIVIGTTTGILCMILIVQAVGNEGSSQVLKVDKITKPTDIHEEDTIPEKNAEEEIIRQYNRMIQFKNLVDKLSSSSDTHSLDSLMRVHPGLRDSLSEFVERYYSH